MSDATGSSGPRWLAGVAGGLVGGTVMLVVLMIAAVGRGFELWAPAKLIAATALGSAAATGAAGTVLLGVAIHLVTACAFGVVYAYLASRNVTVTTDVLVGLAYGAVVYMFMSWVVLPWANPILLATVHRVWFFVAHLAFGVTLALVAQLRRASDGGIERPEYRPTQA